MDTSLSTMQKIATDCGITLDKTRYWVSLLDIEVVKIGRVRHLRGSDSKLLEKMAALVAGGLSPIMAAATLKAAPDQSPEPTRTGEVNKTIDPVSKKLDDLGNALVRMAGEIAAIHSEVVSLRSENAALRVLLLPPPSKPVEAWRPEPARPDPREKMNFFERVFCELFAPDRLRRFAS